MQYKILYQKHYYQRELFALELDSKFAFVYRGSGLNGGKVGKVLPFTYIKDTPPRFSEMMSGIDIGWIAKEFFFNENYHMHRKRISGYGPGVLQFIQHLEDTLPGINPNESFEEEYINEDFVKQVSQELRDSVKGMQPFDWNHLNEEINNKEG